MPPISSLSSTILSLMFFNPMDLLTYPCLGRGTEVATNIDGSQDSGPQISMAGPTSPDRPILRDAQLSDLDDVTSILADAFAGSAAWEYSYQYRKEYPAYHWYCLREDLRQQYQDRDKDTVWVKVLEVGLTDEERKKNGGRETRVVSVSSWKDMDQSRPGYWDPDPVSNLHSRVGEGTVVQGEDGERFDCSLRLDLNVTRLEDYQRQYNKLRRPYVDDAYPRQLHLNTLATHPDFDGRGYAAELVRWGTREAKELGIGPVTLVSSPAGHGLYRRLGFVDLGDVFIERLDGGEKLWFEAMRWRK